MQQMTKIGNWRSGLRTRQARLKAEYGSLYPSIEPGVWLPAASLADRLLADCLLSGRCAALRGRRLVDTHFEFRGGSSLGGERAGMRNLREVTA